jgi:glycogen synthase
LKIPVTLDGHTFDFEVYKHTFPDGQTVVYFWDEWQLGWTIAPAYIYPSDPEVAFKLFAAVSQAMAGYIEQGNFDTIHSHDYHVGLIPFYLSDEFLARVPHHFTIHNATYQGMYPVYGRGYERLGSINLSGEKFFHKYFDFFDHLNFMKAAMIKTHESGGKITTHIYPLTALTREKRDEFRSRFRFSGKNSVCRVIAFFDFRAGV